MLADTLDLLPVDDRDVLHAVDFVDAHQLARRQFLDHGAHRIIADLVAGKHLQADGAWPQRLHAAIIGEGPQADEQETGHQCAVDDGLPGPEVGRDRAVAGHRSAP
jgi:hypothetical protein